ncbi:MAG: hypothetical protein QXK35_05895 [Nitrososphaerales archaeon]
MADIIAKTLLSKYRDHFGNVFVSPISSDFPKPDFIFIPIEISRSKITSHEKIFARVIGEEKKSYPTAFEFKTPYVYKHEYISGIGQAVTYHSIFVRSYLIVPDYNIEHFKVSQFIVEIIEKAKLKIGLISYDPKNLGKVKIEKESCVIEREPENLVEATRGITRSYAYWRETRPNEVYEFLNITHKVEEEAKLEENIKDKVLNMLWDKVLSSRFKKAERKASFLLNYNLLFSQLGLWDKKGKLTPLGRYTLLQGERFGKGSSDFQDLVTYLLLRYGGHYLLLRKIYLVQSKLSSRQMNTWEKWIKHIKAKLADENFYISEDDFRMDFPRLPYAYENHFSGIVARPKFIEGRGLNINWPKILDILDKGKRIYSPIEIE